MIRLRALRKSFRDRQGTTPVFDAINLDLPGGRCIGVIGDEGAGKSTLLKLLCGLEQADSGSIDIDGGVAIPFGQNPGLTPQLSARENTTFAARVFGLPTTAMVRKVEELANLGAQFDAEIGGYGRPQRLRLNIAILMAANFKWYLVDDQLPIKGNRQNERLMLEFEALKKRSGMLIASTRFNLLREHCDSVIVLGGRSAVFYDDLEQGLQVYREVAARPGRRRKGAKSMDDSDDVAEAGQSATQTDRPATRAHRRQSPPTGTTHGFDAS
ncbi:MAG TPA: ATP-binding cassette domain-containing protein [Gammaproteobacteria bacterium]|nr:ATP-binding cassette domain-containing protein [Gammaproteobacteria bacterium]MCP5439052.1 ATP-binding cassette domain-containing protein [Chromatiaceae bacterium]HPQ23915.1 ATP-binding cassette domain-containing protein [Gammaproteobacteria bacterium]